MDSAKVKDMSVIMGRLDGPVDFLSVGQFISGPGWSHMRRTIDFFELVVVRRGVLPIAVADRRLRIAQGGIALIQPGEEHAGTGIITENLEFYWLHFKILRAHTLADEDPLPQDDRCLLLPALGRATEPDRLAVMFNQMLDLYAAFGPHANLHCDYFATSLLLEVSAQTRASVMNEARDPGLAPMLSVRSWIHANAFEPLSVAAVSRRFHYSQSYLTALYRRVFGIGIVEQISEYRIERARELLSSTATPVGQIAHEIGYDDPKYFMRVFKRRTGLTPSQYRDAFPVRLYNTV